MIVKTAVFAPMPNPRDITTTIVKTGVRRSVSQAVRKVLRELVHEQETARVTVQFPGALNASQATERFTSLF